MSPSIIRTYTRKTPEFIQGVEELCRLCLEKVQEEPTYIFSKESVIPSLVTRIMMCIGIQVIEEEYLPKIICKNCEKELEHSYAFRKKCEINNQKLNSHVRAIHMAKRKVQIVKQEDKNIQNNSSTDTDRTLSNSQEINEELILPDSSYDGILSNETVKSSDVHVNTNNFVNNNNKLIVTSGNFDDENDKIVINYEFVKIHNDNDIGDYTEIDFGPAEESNRNIEADEIVLPHNESEMESNLIIQEIETVKCSEKPPDYQNITKMEVLFEANHTEMQDQTNLKAAIMETNSEEHLRVFLMNKMEENSIVALDGEYIAYRDAGTAGFQLVTADGSLVTMQFAEEDEDFSIPSSTSTTVNADKKTSCDYSYKDLSSLNCTECGKLFSSRAVLKRHMLVHASDLPHACSLCHRAFKQKAVLTRHMLVHAASRPYSCSVCARGFTQRGALAAHARSHAAPPARPLALHRCHACRKLFLHPSGLSRHMKTHSGAIYPCPSCGREFRDQSSLKRHSRSHMAISSDPSGGTNTPGVDNTNQGGET